MNVAERLFSERGYNAVKLKDIADALNIRQASLYYHAPGGKEQLFIAVTERMLTRYQQGLRAALASAPTLHESLRAAMRYLLAQPPMNLSRMVHSDMPNLPEAEAHRLAAFAFDALLMPLDDVFRAAHAHGEIHAEEPGVLPGMFIAFIEGVGAIPERSLEGISAYYLADAMLTIMMRGLAPRSQPTQEEENHVQP